MAKKKTTKRAVGKASAAQTPIILCAGANGRAVVFGWVDRLPEPGRPVTLHRARMVLRWASRGLLGLAASGPTGDTRITAAVAWTTATVWQESMAVSPQAAAAIDGWPAYGG